MQVSRDNLSPTKVKLSVSADQAVLSETKESVLKDLGRNVRLQGFRAGKAPLSLVEKQVDQKLLQSDFLEAAVNRLYTDVMMEQKLHPVAQPQISITKFVPFTTLEFDAEVEVVGEVTLADYKKIKLTKKPVSVTAKDVDGVIANLRQRVAEREEVKRAAQDGDEVTIDFKGTDAKTGEAISGADGKDYPLILGSNTFIPGFEPNLIGLKAGQEKTFNITFPKDYGVTALQSRKVTFKVKASKVQKIVEPKVDDAFAAKVGPFKTVAELKADIKKQLEAEQQNQADRDFESELLTKIAEKSKVAIPQVLIDEEVERQEAAEKQNLAYRGQTWQEHLKDEGVSEDEHRARKRPEAELRVKAGLILSEVADKENVTITPEELEIRLQLMKGQYQDAAMQAELDKPEAKREIASRLLSEKTIQKLTSYASRA